MSRRGLWAWASLLSLLAAVVLAVAVAVEGFPRGVSVLACLGLGVVLALYALEHRGAARIVLSGLAGVAVLGGLVLIVFEGRPLLNALVALLVVAAVTAGREAFATHVPLPAAAAPRHPVLFYNPLSGGGKAERFKLAEEAQRRGYQTVELRRGDRLEQLVSDALDNGADALAMAGGDGSQAIVAMIAAQRDLPYACIPAGTRNHFALDLGVIRDDVVGALDAFVDGRERRVDLATVNGQVFVNNVSLGLYAEAVQQAGYREAKIRTILATVPDVIGPDASPHLSWQGPDGPSSAVALLVSNNGYRLGRALGSGTRPRLDSGQLGVTAFGDGGHSGAATLRMRQWTAPTFQVDSDGPIAAGVDGEAMTFDSPLRFEIRAGALRVRIAPSHPGASPSALMPSSPIKLFGALWGFALGRADPGDG